MEEIKSNYITTFGHIGHGKTTLVAAIASYCIKLGLKTKVNNSEKKAIKYDDIKAVSVERIKEYEIDDGNGNLENIQTNIKINMARINFETEKKIL